MCVSCEAALVVEHRPPRLLQLPPRWPTGRAAGATGGAMGIGSPGAGTLTITASSAGGSGCGFLPTSGYAGIGLPSFLAK